MDTRHTKQEERIKRTKQDIDKLIIELSNNFTKIITIDEIKKYDELYWGSLTVILKVVKVSQILLFFMNFIYFYEI